VYMAGSLQLEREDQIIFASIMNRIAKTRLIANASRDNATMHQKLVASAMHDIEGWTNELRIVAQRVSALNRQLARLGESEERVVSKMNDVLQRIASGLASEEELVTLENELRRIQGESATKMAAYDQARTELTRLIAAIKGELAHAPDEGGPGGPGQPGGPRGGPPGPPASRSLWDRLTGRNRPGATAVGLGRQGSVMSETEIDRRLAEEGVYRRPPMDMSDEELQRELEALGADSDEEGDANPWLYSQRFPADAARMRAQGSEEDEEHETSLGGGGSSLRRGGYTYPKKRTLRRRRKQNKARKTHHAKKAHKKKQKTRGRKVHKKRTTHKRRR
jgi:hypothetical protein